MERLLRGIIQVGGLPDQDDCLKNWLIFREHSLDTDREEDQKIVNYADMFYSQMSAPPDMALVKEYFEKADDIETVARLDEISKAQVYIRTNYLSIARSVQEQQQIKKLVMICREAGAIAEHGRHTQAPGGKSILMRGVNDAVNFIFERLPDFTRVEGGEKLEGVVSEDADEVIDEYELTKQTNTFANRLLFGLEPVDFACKGHRAGEFWVHVAFTGELKTTLAANYVYNNAYVYGKNMFYGEMEMPYIQLRRQLYIIHSSHGKFVNEWNKEDGYTGLDYRKVRDGELSPRDFERLKIVAQDFKANCKGKLYVWRSPEDITTTDFRRKAEMFHNKYGCDGVIIDHMGLFKPSRSQKTSDFVTTQNNIVRDCRMLALNFARGKTVPVLALSQMNRQGKMRADKNDGHYDFASISYANEIEKSADVITYTYLNDELRKEGKFYLGNLKNRDNPVFDRMIGKIFWQSKRMRHMETGLIDPSNDHVLSIASKIQLTAEDMLHSGAFVDPLARVA